MVKCSNHIDGNFQNSFVQIEGSGDGHIFRTNKGSSYGHQRHSGNHRKGHGYL